jgi:RNA polymerase sigma factor (sigma-70 family)
MTDAELAPLYRDGVPGVLEELYRRHHECFRRQASCLAHRLPGGLTPDDLLQEHLLRLHQQHCHYVPEYATNPANPWQPWASTLLVNVALNMRRGGVRQVPDPQSGHTVTQQRETTGHENLGADLASREPDPAEQAAANELAEAIADCVNKLDEPQRTMLLLRIQGRKPQEIAELYDMTSQNVSTLIHQARQAVRQCLDREGHQGV